MPDSSLRKEPWRVLPVSKRSTPRRWRGFRIWRSPSHQKSSGRMRCWLAGPQPQLLARSMTAWTPSCSLTERSACSRRGSPSNRPHSVIRPARSQGRTHGDTPLSPATAGYSRCTAQGSTGRPCRGPGSEYPLLARGTLMHTAHKDGLGCSPGSGGVEAVCKRGRNVVLFEVGLLGSLPEDVVIVRVWRIPGGLGDVLPPLLHEGSNRCDPLASFFGVLQTAGRCHAVAGFDAVQFHQSKVLPDLIAAVAFE